ncbi:hypothetical protein IG631_16936 [Alternaria alternata]|nr:hypothetical protein IG631_16936 [Alternaria alternata]
MNFRTFAIALVACGIASARVIEKRQGTPGASYQSYTGTGNEGGGGCRGARVQLGSHLRGQESRAHYVPVYHAGRAIKFKKHTHSLSSRSFE